MSALPETRHIQTLCRAYCEKTRLSEVRVADLSVSNPYLLRRLRAGKGCTVKTYNRAFRWFSDHWPPGLEWPPGISRPAPSKAGGGEAA